LSLLFVVKILQKSGSIVTTWNNVDFLQMKSFTDSWKTQQAFAKQIPNPSPSIPPASEDDPHVDTPPILSPTHSMINGLESFHMGSTPPPGESSKGGGGGSGRTTRRKTSGGSVSLKNDVARAIQAAQQSGIIKPDYLPNENRSSGSSTGTPPVSSNPGVPAPPALSMIEHWHTLRSQQLGIEYVTGLGSLGKGIIVFERSTEVIILYFLSSLS
jgi:hypothetical protein